MKKIILAATFVSLSCVFFHVNANENTLEDAVKDALGKSVVTLQSKSTRLCAAAGRAFTSYSGKPITQKRCNNKPGQKWSIHEEKNLGISKPQLKILKEAYLKAEQGWIDAFNAGDIAAVTNLYESNAVMDVKSVLDFGGVEVAGVRRGAAEIEAFWALSINDFGLDDANYVKTEVTFIDDKTVFSTSNFTLNNVGGFVNGEIWVLQDDGSMKLRYDEFTITYFK